MTTSEPHQDSVLPFSIDSLNVRGRIVRMHSLPQELLRHHEYPDAVNHVLMQAASMCVLLGTAIKHEGRMILQTASNGPLSMIVVDYEAAQDGQIGRTRAYAQFDEAKIAAHPQDNLNTIMGSGHLALTIDMGTDESRYQGVVALDEQGLTEAANHYFKQSEQLPTRLVLMSAKIDNEIVAGGVFLQSLPPLTDAIPVVQQANDNENGEDINPFETDIWREAEARMMTITADELLEEDIDLGHLLLRLFHSHGVRVFDTVPVEAFCRCSIEKIREMLLQFPAEDRADMELDGKVGVKCEFCSRSYEFAASEL